MKKMCIICPYPVGVAPSQRLKFEQYCSFFEKEGWKIEVHSFQTNSFWKIVYDRNNYVEKILWTLYGYLQRIIVLFRLRNFDIVYIHLWVTPFGLPIFEWLYRFVAKKIVFDIDDLIFIENPGYKDSWKSRVKGTLKPKFLISHSDYVVTTTPFLVDFCKKSNQNVIGIPPSLDEKTIYPFEKKSNTRMVIGWSGSHSTMRYVPIVEKAIQNVAKKYDIEFLVFGVKDYALEGVKTRTVVWSAEIENNIFNEMDIALYPQEKELWAEGKYGGKMIQYLAAGLPMIISNSNSLVPKIVQNREDGLIVDNNDVEWEKAIVELIEDENLRKKLSINARKLFLKNYSFEVNKNKYLEVLNTTLQSKSQKSIL